MSLRRTPYTERGVRRLPCVRCGKPASRQWNACADGQYRPICTDCDILLNRLVLQFMRIPAWKEKIRKYKAAIAKAE